MNESIRHWAQIALVVVAVVSAGAGVWRYLDSRSEGAPILGSRPEVVPQPSSGPVGTRPNLDIEGFDDSSEVTVWFCAPQSQSTEDGCVELATGSAGRITSPQVAPIPPTIPGPDGDIEVAVDTTFLLRAKSVTDTEPAQVRGEFRVVEFAIGELPPPRSWPPDAPLVAGDPRTVAEGVDCIAGVTPDNRLVVGGDLLDPRTGVITELDLQGRELRWSPARDRLAILTGDRKEIRLATPDGADPSVVVREARGLLSSISWSPEGDRFAYVARSEPGVPGGPGAPQVFVFSLIEGPLGAVGAGESVDWSPDGERLAIEGPGGVIELADTGGGNRQKIADGRRPAWSPDGSRVGFVRFAGGEAGQALVARVDGSGESSLVPDGVCALDFSAEGSRLLAARRAEGTTILVVHDLRAART